MPHLVVHSDAPQGSPEWLAARREGVGSSDSAIVLGLSEYASPYELWQSKRGERPDQVDNWFMARGRALEPVIRQHYSDTTGRVVHHLDGTLRHPDLPWLLASLDGYTEDNRLTEFKTATSRKGWGEAGSDQVPTAYMVQVQHAMLVTGFEVADVSVSIAGLAPVMYEVPADAEIQQAIVEECAAFWEMVQKGVEPALGSAEERAKRGAMIAGLGAAADESAIDAYVRLIALRAQRKDVEAEIGRAEEQIKSFLVSRSADVLLDNVGDKLVSWTEVKGRESIDPKALKEAHPEIAAKFTKVGNPYRTLRVYGE